MFGDVTVSTEDVCSLELLCGYVIRTTARNFRFTNTTTRQIAIRRVKGKVRMMPAGGSFKLTMGGSLCELIVDGKSLQIISQLPPGISSTSNRLKPQDEEDGDRGGRVMGNVNKIL